MDCCGSICGAAADDMEREPLLEQMDATERQAQFRAKMQMFEELKAMSQEYMPSTEQVVRHLKASLESPLVNQGDNGQLSKSSRALSRTFGLWLKQWIVLLESKNAQDQIQDLVWYLSKADLELDVDGIADDVADATSSAKNTAAVESLKSVATLALQNDDFRTLLADLTTITKQVLRDAADAVGDASKKASKKLQAGGGKTDMDELKATDKATQKQASLDKVQKNLNKVSDAVKEDAGQIADEVTTSVEEHLDDEAQGVLLSRAKSAIETLRQNKDYSDSVPILSGLLKRYLRIWLTVAKDAANAIEDGVELNEDATRAGQKLWSFLSSFGSEEKWQQASDALSSFIDKHSLDQDLDDVVGEVGGLVQDMLCDPDFYDNPQERLRAAGEKLQGSSTSTEMSSLREDVGELMTAVQQALASAADDDDVKQLVTLSSRIVSIVSPRGEIGSPDLLHDLVNTFLPLLISSVQCVPIPRVELSTPQLDLLLENVIVSPGQTVNHSSFLPHSAKISSNNDLEISKNRLGNVSSTATSVLRLRMDGISVAADELGYWMRVRTGLGCWLADEGIASFHLDESGISVDLTLEIARDGLDELVSVRHADVRVNHLDYTLSTSKLSWLAWLLKPVVRPILRQVLRSQLSSAIEDGVKALNRELVFGRERLRAARVCGPSSVWTFVRAVAARATSSSPLSSNGNPDVSAHVGFGRPDSDIFRGRYTPGSLIKVWEEEARDADQNIFEYREGGWRNKIFDAVAATAPTM